MLSFYTWDVVIPTPHESLGCSWYATWQHRVHAHHPPLLIPIIMYRKTRPSMQVAHAIFNAWIADLTCQDFNNTRQPSKL